ncbi:MAG TPA: ferrous iron transport protein A [Clostridia bacterium]|jgi:Fe2+ transport system protein FeoA
MTIYDLKIGDCAEIIKVGGFSAKRLTELGYTQNTKIKVLNKSLFDGRLILIRDNIAGLRGSLAKSIEVRLLKAGD